MNYFKAEKRPIQSYLISFTSEWEATYIYTGCPSKKNLKRYISNQVLFEQNNRRDILNIKIIYALGQNPKPALL